MDMNMHVAILYILFLLADDERENGVSRTALGRGLPRIEVFFDHAERLSAQSGDLLVGFGSFG